MNIPRPDQRKGSDAPPSPRGSSPAGHPPRFRPGRTWILFALALLALNVYLGSRVDPSALAVLAPPWSAVPWQVLALAEEAVVRGVGAFSESEARRRSVPWLDRSRCRG